MKSIILYILSSMIVSVTIECFDLICIKGSLNIQVYPCESSAVQPTTNYLFIRMQIRRIRMLFGVFVLSAGFFLDIGVCTAGKN